MTDAVVLHGGTVSIFPNRQALRKGTTELDYGNCRIQELKVRKF